MQVGIKHINFLLIFLLNISCNYFFVDNPHKVDEFYLHYTYLDCYKIPLIKPSNFFNCNPKNHRWILSNGYEGEGIILDSFNVLDSIVIGKRFFDSSIRQIYNRSDIKTYIFKNLNDSSKAFLTYPLDTNWFIFNVKANQTYAFRTEKGFMKKIKKFIKSQIQFLDIDNTNQKLLDTGYLSWFPNDVKTKLKK
jgi:hypothetical protein